MANRISSRRRIVWYSIGAIGLFLAAIAVLFPSQVSKTFLLFPNYNPFSAKNYSILDLNSLRDVTAIANSQLVNFTLPFGAEDSREVLVYLPKGYDEKNTDVLYPVLYLLHGSPGVPEDWLDGGKAQETFDRLIDEGTVSPFIAVFPDGNGGLLYDTQYINSTDGKQPNEDFIADTVVTYIDNTFQTRAETGYRSLMGLSSGGFGALNISLHHQDLFGQAAAISGYGAIEQNALSDLLIQDSKETIRANSPVEYIPSLSVHDLHVFLDTGLDDGLLEKTRELEQLLRSTGFEVTLVTPSGTHDWTFWSGQLDPATRWVSREWDRTTESR